MRYLLGEMPGKHKVRGSQAGRIFKLPGSSNTCERREGGGIGKEEPQTAERSEKNFTQANWTWSLSKLNCENSPTRERVAHCSTSTKFSPHWSSLETAWPGRNIGWVQRCKDYGRLSVSYACRAGYLKGRAELVWWYQAMFFSQFSGLSVQSLVTLTSCPSVGHIFWLPNQTELHCLLLLHICSLQSRAVFKKS